MSVAPRCETQLDHTCDSNSADAMERIGSTNAAASPTRKSASDDGEIHLVRVALQVPPAGDKAGGGRAQRMSASLPDMSGRALNVRAVGRPLCGQVALLAPP